MKKSVVAVLLICFVLSGCGAKSIGIIGGADGPTAVYVTDDSDDKYEKDNADLLNIGGTLYYDTDKDYDAEKGVLELDGKLKNTGKEFFVPQKNGECNFDDAAGYRFGADKDAVYVLVDDEWHVFKKLNADAEDYKYCFVLDGRLPNAACDSEYLVLANEKNISFDDAAYKFFGSDTRKMKDIYVLPLADD